MASDWIGDSISVRAVRHHWVAFCMRRNIVYSQSVTRRRHRAMPLRPRVSMLATLLWVSFALGLLYEPASTAAQAGDAKSGNKSTTTRKAQENIENVSASSPEALKRATKALRAGDHEQARSMILAAYRATRSTNVKDAWAMVEAELELSQNNPAKAVLLAMRVVILRPESEHAAPALYLAGRAYEKIGRPSKAIELYRECLDHKSSGDALRKKAQRRADALSKKAR